MSERILITLYIAGMTPAASTAVNNLRRICSELSNDHVYELEIVDIREHPEIAEQKNILATPTAVKELPPPIRRIIGDLSDAEQALFGLGLKHL